MDSKHDPCIHRKPKYLDVMRGLAIGCVLANIIILGSIWFASDDLFTVQILTTVAAAVTVLFGLIIYALPPQYAADAIQQEPKPEIINLAASVEAKQAREEDRDLNFSLNVLT